VTEDLADGWHSAEDRKLMVRALARFSEECENPELTPECPFYERDAKGNPACAEQCLDLLARYPDDVAPDHVIGLGAGLGARRRRVRRGPPEDEMAYDAAQVALEDAEKPLSEWRFGALMMALRKRARMPLAVRDDHTSHDLIEEMARRGVDVAVVIPHALGRVRSGAIQMAVLLSGVDDPRSSAGGMTENPSAWLALLESIGGIDRTETGFPIVNPAGARALAGWITTSEPAVVLTDTMPTLDDLLYGLSVDVDDGLRRDGDWLTDRFTETYVHDWTPESRAREWRYIGGQRTGCCPPGLMRQRAIDPNDLAAQMADEHCTDHESRASEPSWTPEHFKHVALEHLHAGRRAEAVQVFRVLADLHPADGDIQNNLGFCLIGVDPKGAVEQLRAAIARGTSTTTLTRMNLALAVHLAGDGAEAASLLRTTLAESESNESNYFVWRLLDGGVVEFEKTGNILRYGEDLAGHFASCGGGCASAGLF